MTRFEMEAFRERLETWKTERARLHKQEAAGNPARPRQWRRSRADAVAIAADLAELMGIGCVDVWTVTVEDHTRFEGGACEVYAVHAPSREQAESWTAAWHARTADATDVLVVACEKGMPRAHFWEDARAASRQHFDQDVLAASPGGGR
ncbi:hypothetical protein ACIBEJ_00765 [Nonomuraea sp. NPDC050790]|uniref:hypothetical protein n=1 Tax=Nonomuraea sp. NPDC050790 TaxID=3364371 RepID=UPI0037AF5B37